MTEQDELLAKLERGLPEPSPFVTEEGSWPVTIVSFEERQGYSKRHHLHVRFRLGENPRERLFIVRLRVEGCHVGFESPMDLPLLPVLKAGRGKLETKIIPTKDGKKYVHHKWSV